MPKLKAKLTRAKKTKEPDKVLAVVTEAYAAFDRWGAYPDNWRLFEVAKTDAESAKARGLKLL
jgi:hypothetical protein